MPFLPNLLEIEFLGLSLEGPFKGLDDELLLLLEELVNGLEGELFELEVLLESFLPVISRASGFETNFFLLHPIDVVSILGFEAQSH